MSAVAPRGWQWRSCSLTELSQQLGSPSELGSDIVVVDRPGSSAIYVAKRLAESSSRTQLVFLLEPLELPSFQWAVALNPGLGSPLALDASAPATQIATALREAHEVFQYQASMRSAVENINFEVKSRNDAALANVSRQRASDRYLANLLAQIPDPIVSTDLSGAIVSWNDAAAAIFGLSIDAVLGRAFEGFFAPDTSARLRALFEHAATQRETKHDELTLSVHGAELHFDTLFARTVDATGQPEGVLIILRDITDLRVAQTQLEAQTRELERSNADLAQFAYVAAHDLKEPLRTVGSYSQLLVRRFAASEDSDSSEFVGYITRGVQRMNNLLDDLLDYSRLGGMELTYAPTPVEKVVRQAVENVGAALSENQVEIIWAPLPALDADANQLVRVFQNLISNAIKFRRDVPPRIHISAQRNGEEWLFAVNDNGIGIEAQYFDYIFVPFKRLHTQENHPGSGVGLAICKKIIERHGGSMWLESVVGAGTTFYFSLPHRDG